MTIEYQIQMLVDGEWKRACYPNGQGYSPYRNLAESAKAEEGIQKLREAWRENWCKNPRVPSDFRVVCRAVTDWAPLD